MQWFGIEKLWSRKSDSGLCVFIVCVARLRFNLFFFLFIRCHGSQQRVYLYICRCQFHELACEQIKTNTNNVKPKWDVFFCYLLVVFIFAHHSDAMTGCVLVLLSAIATLSEFRTDKIFMRMSNFAIFDRFLKDRSEILFWFEIVLTQYQFSLYLNFLSLWIWTEIGMFFTRFFHVSDNSLLHCKWTNFVCCFDYCCLINPLVVDNDVQSQ